MGQVAFSNWLGYIERMIRWILCLALMLGCTLTVFGQDRPQYRYADMFFIFDDRDVVIDLKLTADQVAQIKSMRADFAKAIQAKGEQFESHGSDGSTSIDGDQLGPEFAKMELELQNTKLKAALSATQFTRMMQLHWQLLGNNALLRKDLQGELHLSKDQIASIRSIQSKLVAAYREDDAPAKARAEKQIQETLAAMGAVLTPEQQVKFRQMQGEPLRRKLGG
jgi:hypothetical protein